MFPTDRSWLVSTLWDDDWTCVGGPGDLVDDVLGDPELGPRSGRVALDHDATPPGLVIATSRPYTIAQWAAAHRCVTHPGTVSWWP